MESHTLHSGNRHLYLGMSILVIAASIYSLSKEGSLFYEQGIAIAAIIITLIWGGYFYILRYRVDEEGVSKSILKSRKLSWEQISEIQLDEQESAGSISCTVTFHSADGSKPIKLSSELIHIEEMHMLIDELRAAGKLPAIEKIIEDEESEETKITQSEEIEEIEDSAPIESSSPNSSKLLAKPTKL